MVSVALRRTFGSRDLKAFRAASLTFGNFTQQRGSGGCFQLSSHRESIILIKSQEHILSLKQVIQNPTPTPVPPWVFNKSLGLSLLSVLVNIWYQIGWSYAFQLSAHKQAVYHRTHLLAENFQLSKISLILVNIFKKKINK